MSAKSFTTGSLTALIAAAALSCGTAQAEPLFAFLAPTQNQIVAPQYAPTEQATDDAQLDPRLQRKIVNYASNEAPGTVIIDTPHTVLYFVLGNGQAIRYGIGVGREGFTWAGVKQVARKAEWPDWIPPQEMIARAMYLGGTVYRIHGTNDPTTIGKHVSSGCIRLTNDDVSDLYSRVQVGAKVIVLPQAAQVAQHAPAPSTNARMSWNGTRPSSIY